MASRGKGRNTMNWAGTRRGFTLRGVVLHAGQRLCYHEIMGHRQRYRLLDFDRLCWRLRTADVEQVRKNLEASLDERIARGRFKLEPCWTQSLAVGSRKFVEMVRPLAVARCETEISEAANNRWVLQEAALPYGQEMMPEIVCKGPLER